MISVFKRSLKLVLIFVLISSTLPKSVYAYLDPGSGSYLIQIIIASIAGAGYLLKLNWQRVKSLFSSKKGKRKTSGEKSNRD